MKTLSFSIFIFSFIFLTAQIKKEEIDKYCPRTLSLSESKWLHGIWKEVSYQTLDTNTCNKAKNALFYAFIKSKTTNAGLYFYMEATSCDEIVQNKEWFQYNISKHTCVPVLVLEDTILASNLLLNKKKQLKLFNILYRKQFSQKELHLIHLYYSKVKILPQTPRGYAASVKFPTSELCKLLIPITDKQLRRVYQTWHRNLVLREYTGEIPLLYCESRVICGVSGQMVDDSLKIGLATFFYNIERANPASVKNYVLYILVFKNKIVVSNCRLIRRIALWEFAFRYKKKLDKREDTDADMDSIEKYFLQNINDHRLKNVYYLDFPSD